MLCMGGAASWQVARQLTVSVRLPINGDSLRPGWSRPSRRLRTARLNALIRAQKPADPSRFRGHLHETRIKLTSRILLELLDGTGKAHRLAIRPVSGHRINGIGDHDDARANGDLFTREPVWIARSVEVLVMVSDHAFNRTTKPPSRRYQLRAPDDVCPHCHHFFYG